MIGAYGFGVEFEDLTANDKMKDLDNTVVVPPNYVKFTVNGAVANEDYILVGPAENGELKEDQLVVDGNHASDSTTLKLTENIPSDTPASGTIRVFDGSGYRKVEYDGFSGDTFNLSDTLGYDVADGASCYISYIDALYDGTADTNTFTVV